jgi:hypothetical protein
MDNAPPQQLHVQFNSTFLNVFSVAPFKSHRRSILAISLICISYSERFGLDLTFSLISWLHSP